MEKKFNNKYLPGILICTLVVGVIAGIVIGSYGVPHRYRLHGSNKVDELMGLIATNYVDTVDYDKLIEEVMPKVLSELDPHSVYIPASDLEATNSDLKGSFSGIGVQFTIQDDTIHINNVIHGGPSEKVGLAAGDRIVTVDDSLFVGKKVNNAEAMRKLKGPKGSEVKLGILRRGSKKLLSYTVVRGDIPVKSIDASYLVNNKYGYLKVNKFGETTYEEMMVAIARFKKANFKGLIIDLRGNLGGYMGAALQMANEFLQRGDMIIYTQGVHSRRMEEYADNTGVCHDVPLIVLIDETSASASEIFAGTIQDNDRGTIIGRRSFGKGLVQQPFEFKDGSAVRLTIARYYTPSGRCIQKPYSHGDDMDYEMDIISRYERGEFFSQDSIKQKGEVYKTKLGRPVYGGGGIMPDIFIPSDTTGFTSYYKLATAANILVPFCNKFTDDHRQDMAKFSKYEEVAAYLKTQPLLEQYVNYADSKGVKRRNIQIEKSQAILLRVLYANIIYNILNIEEQLKYLNKDDNNVLKAVEILDKGRSFPKAPAESKK